MKSLEGLEGASKVTEASKADGIFEVMFKDSAKASPSIVKAALPKKYSVDAFELAGAGQLSSDDKGLWLTARSGQKFLLANRPAKDEGDKPEDLAGKLSGALKDGKSFARVEGTVVEDKDGNLTLQLAKADAAAPEEKK